MGRKWPYAAPEGRWPVSPNRTSATIGAMTITAARSAPPPRAPRRRSIRGRIITGIGLLMIAVGLGLLGWFLWQYFGTNIVSKQAQQRITQSTLDQWENGIEGDAIGLLRVERFGKDFQVPIIKGFDDATLAKGVGMYPKGDDPGAVGNFVIAGHRVTHGEPFRDFLKLRKGDLVEVETRTHIYTYELENNGDAITVDFTTSWPLWPVPDKDWDNSEPTENKITLLTCSELFHTRNRNVAIGHLVKTIDKSKVAPPAEKSATGESATKSQKAGA